LNRKQLLNILRIVISIVLIVFILSKVDLQSLWQVVKGADIWLLLAAIAVIFLGVFIRSVRWKILLDALPLKVSLKELTELYFIGFLFNTILPSGIGGDAIRMYELSQKSERGADAVTSVIVDRFLGMFALLALALVALIFSWWMIPQTVVIVSLVIFLGGTIASSILFNRGLLERLLKLFPFMNFITRIKMVNALLTSFQSYSWRAIWRSFGVSTVFNLTLILMNILIGSALGAHISVLYYFVFVPITSMVLLLPISFGGLGVRESAYVILFTQVGLSQEIALSLSLLVYFLGNVVPGLVGGVIYLTRGARDYSQQIVTPTSQEE
jgi:glycosyltransferase 2 family protein